MARARGIRRSSTARTRFAHFPFKVSDLECDYYGCSLHKWLLAPVGTGFLYVRRENIAKLWPLTPARRARSDNIRKFEEIGTHPAANHNAIARSAGVPPGDRHRAQGRAPALPERSLGEAGGQAAGREDPQQPRAESGVGAVQRQPRGVDAPKAYDFLVDRSTGSSPPRSGATTTRGCASRRTSTRRSRRVDTFASAIEDLLKSGPRRPRRALTVHASCVVKREAHSRSRASVSASVTASKPSRTGCKPWRYGV